MRCVAALLVVTAGLRGQTPTQAMIARVSEEADVFRRAAPSIVGHETLDQKARKAAPRFRPRVGNDAKAPPPVVWQDRQVVSEYGFITFPGDDRTLHELRRVLTVDSHPVPDKKNGESLARIISLKDDQREHELLKEFQKYGLTSAVTDFGPLLMLFTPRGIEHFEFSLKGTDTLGPAKALVFRYTQIDGTELLSIYENKGKTHRLKVQGELWVRADNYLPLRITLAVSDGQGASALREDATVDYAESSFGILVPSAVEHKELIGGQLYVQNSFIYSDFHKFGADAQIEFGSSDKTSPDRTSPDGTSPDRK